jgi:hypothetical protein
MRDDEFDSSLQFRIGSAKVHDDDDEVDALGHTKKSHKAKPKYDEHGNLIPHIPKPRPGARKDKGASMYGLSPGSIAPTPDSAKRKKRPRPPKKKKKKKDSDDDDDFDSDDDSDLNGEAKAAKAAPRKPTNDVPAACEWQTARLARRRFRSLVLTLQTAVELDDDDGDPSLALLDAELADAREVKDVDVDDDDDDDDENDGANVRRSKKGKSGQQGMSLIASVMQQSQQSQEIAVRCVSQNTATCSVTR